ncbi:class II aldolase/adducin family protein [Zavarzinia sp. CC-PAN008]|uniref:class II aldolase/adducin family protein n=1 Tax=Zavarzinia sp. CC-PAN008 TaxID=3243332 RepID=UPI003F742CB3
MTRLVSDVRPDDIRIESEADARVHLTAVYRLLAHFGMDDTIFTHASARVPGEDAFLINPFGRLFREITPASLVKLDYRGNVRAGKESANAAGYVIHGAILEAKPQLACVIHTHTRAGVALSCLKTGLLPISQFALEFHGRVGVHEYEGLALDLEEQQRLAADLGDNVGLILRNHGLLTVGHTIPAAFNATYYIEQSARVQMDVLASGQPISELSAEFCDREVQKFSSVRDPARAGMRLWPAMLRLLDDVYPGWSNN